MIPKEEVYLCGPFFGDLAGDGDQPLYCLIYPSELRQTGLIRFSEALRELEKKYGRSSSVSYFDVQAHDWGSELKTDPYY